VHVKVVRKAEENSMAQSLLRNPNDAAICSFDKTPTMRIIHN
jgi:hypothetical protein